MRFGTIQEMKIADVHAHVFPEKLAVKAAGSIGQFYGTEMYGEASMERLVAEEEKAGVSRYVISSSAVGAEIPQWSAPTSAQPPSC